MKVQQYTYTLSIGESKIFAVYKISLNHFPSVIINRLLLGNFFWREGLEAAFGAGRKGGDRPLSCVDRIPIRNPLVVTNPRAFLITLEQPGGVVASKQEVVVALAKTS